MESKKTEQKSYIERTDVCQTGRGFGLGCNGGRGSIAHGIDVNYIHCGDHSVVYINTELLTCAPKLIKYYVPSLSQFFKITKNIKKISKRIL